MNTQRSNSFSSLEKAAHAVSDSLICRMETRASTAASVCIDARTSVPNACARNVYASARAPLTACQRRAHVNALECEAHERSATT